MDDSIADHGNAAGRRELQEHLRRLGCEPDVPEAALQACVARFAEIAQPLRALLDRAALGRVLTDEEALRFFRGLHVLAAAGDTQSCASLLRFLRRPPEVVDDLLGDAVTMTLTRILISLFDGDADALLDVVADRSLDEFVRGAAFSAAIYLTWRRRIDRERMRRFLLDFYEQRLGKKAEYVWSVWMTAVAQLDYGDLVPHVEAAWKGRWIDHAFQEWRDFGLDLARARTAYDDPSRFDPDCTGAIDNVVAALEWTRHVAEADAPEPPADESWTFDGAAPAHNPYREIGRNDPCPCGSGKKAKKCCLATGA